MKTRQVREKFMGCARVARVSLAAATLAAFTASAASLTHRWSFNGTTDAENLRDSIDTSITATKYTSKYSWDGASLLMRGDRSEGSKGISLGSNLIDTSAATLEIWATQRDVCTWNAIFEYAVDTSNNVRWRFNRDTADYRQSLGAPGVSAEENFRHTLDEPAHFSVTFSTVGGVTAVRWMRRNAKTGAIEYEYSGTMSNALADFNNPQLLIGGTMWNDKTSNADFDEVRIWNGVLSDDQLTANVLAGPDTPLGGGTSGVDISANATFTIPTTGGYGFKTDRTATIGEGAKIRFDTTGYFGTGLRFKTGGITVPSGDVLDYVELSDTVNYAATMEDENTILVRLKDAVPYTSTWIGSAPSTAADLSNPANWASTNAVGAEVSAAPTSATTVIIPADKLGAFSPPVDASVNWGRIFFGGQATATRYGYKAGAPDSLHNAWRNLALTSYTNIGAVPNGANDISYFTGATGGPATPAELSMSQIRLDGWFYVTAAQAGRWSMPNHFDDVLTFAIDGEWVLLNSTYLFTNGAGAFVSEGWHRFTLVVADTTGGWGSNYKFADGVYVPFVVSINGGEAMTFTADDFTFGSDEITVTLSDDLDWRALGTPVLSNAVTIDLNGHTLIVNDMDADVFGAKIVNTSESDSTIYVTVEPAVSRILASGIVAGVPVVRYGSSTATWTGAAGDGNAVNAANWIVKDGDGNVLEGLVPNSATPVTIAGENVDMTNNVGALQCASFTIGACTFTADCDWRELAITPQIGGTANLNGHKIKLARLVAFLGGAFENSADGIAEVQFEATGNATESDFIENCANLRTAANARIAIIAPTNGFTTDGDINVGNNGLHVALVQTDGDINVRNTLFGGYVSGTSGYGYYVMSDGTLSAGEVAASGYGNGEFLQTGGDVEARIWLNIGRYGGHGVYKMTGGTLTAGTDESSSNVNNHFALIGATGGTGVFDIGGDAVATFLGTGHYISCGSSFGGGSNHGEIYVRDNAKLTVNGAYGGRAIALGTDAGVNNSGKMVQTGGTITTTPNRIAVGVGGTGEYTISGGTAICSEVKVAEKASVTGTLTMDGGTIVADKITGGNGNSTVVANGGTFKPAVGNAGIFTGVKNLTYGAGGLIVDTDGLSATLANIDNPTVLAGSALVKDGEGTLTVPVLPPVDTVRVKKGFLQLESIGTAVCGTLDLAGGTLDQGGNTSTWSVLMGNGGRVRNGTLVVTDTIRLHAGDCITASGVIDLSNAKVEIVDMENIRHFTFIKAAENVALNIVGTPELVDAPVGWKVSVTFKGAKVTKSGFTIYLR